MAFAEAKELYEEWHDFEPEGVIPIDIPEPRGDLRYLGLLKRLDYMSPKWEGDNVYYYHHFRKGWPRLYIDRDGNYHIYGYIRITPDGIDDWLKTQIFEWKRPNVRKGVSKLGILQLLAYEDAEDGKTKTEMFGDRYYVGNPSKDFTYISSPMRMNPRSKPIAVRSLEMIVDDIQKDKKAMRVLERALGNLPKRNPIPLPIPTAAVVAQTTAAQAFLKSIVTGVSTATFGVGITATILGSLLVNFLLNTIKNKVSPPTMPPPPKWVMNMTKSYVAAGVKDPKDITDRIQEIWNQQSFESKVGIYEGEYGKVEEDEEADVEEPEVEGEEVGVAGATENPAKTTKIFVYGSLRKDGWNARRFYGLRPEFPGAIKTEKGTIKGELRAFNMPQVDTKGEGTVLGELVTFDKRFTPEVLKHLDGFEGAYNRVEVEVTLEDGRKEKAWVYEVKYKGEGTDWEAAGRWGGIHLIRHGDYMKFIKEDYPKERIKRDREERREKPYKEFLEHSKHGPLLLMEHEEWKVRKAEREKEEELHRDEEMLRLYSRENPKEYTKEELELKALEMVFRWAYNSMVRTPTEAYHFFMKKGISLDPFAVSHAFTEGKKKRHKDDAKKGRRGGDLPYIANPIRSKAQWRLFKARYPQLFEDWQRRYPVKYGDLPERAEENPLTYADFKEAVEGEGWAIGDYAAMISEADTEKERWMLTHIRNEENEHLDELVELMECKKAPPRKANPEAKEWIRKMIASGEALDRLSDYNQEARDYWLGKGTRFFKPASPSGQVKIHRATIGNEIRLGDYVSNSLDYVRYHMETSMLGERKRINILSKVVSMEELMPADGPNEFYLVPPKRKAKANPTAWSSPDGRWRVEEWGPQDFTVVEILSMDPIARAMGEDARVWPARFKTIQGAIRKASKLAGVTYTANPVISILDPTRRDGR